MDEIVRKALLRLQNQCVRREYSVSDIRKKALKLLDGDTSKTEEVVNSLIKDKFVDDLRYASAFAREKASISGWGRVKIAYMLRAKGISDDIVNEAMSDVDEGKSKDKMERIISAKYKTLKSDPQWKIKLIRYSLSRGYQYDEIMEHINSLGRED